MHNRVEKRFLKAVRSSGLVPDAEMKRCLDLQAFATQQGRPLSLDRILLKLQILDREQILGLWRALRYYVWRKEDKFYVKIAIQSAILTTEIGKQCLGEQKEAYKHDNALVRVNEIARQRGYLKPSEDRAIVRAMYQKHEELTIKPVDDDVAAQPYERRSTNAAPSGSGRMWREEARQKDLDDLKAYLDTDSEVGGVSDEDLDALWEEADLDDVELDSQAIEIARTPLLDESDEEEDLFL